MYQLENIFEYRKILQPPGFMSSTRFGKTPRRGEILPPYSYQLLKVEAISIAIAFRSKPSKKLAPEHCECSLEAVK